MERSHASACSPAQSPAGRAAGVQAAAAARSATGRSASAPSTDRATTRAALKGPARAGATRQEQTALIQRDRFDFEWFGELVREEMLERVSGHQTVTREALSFAKLGDVLRGVFVLAPARGEFDENR